MAANKIVKSVIAVAGAGALLSGSAFAVSTMVLTGNKDNNFSITVSSDFQGHENYTLEYQKGVTAKTLKDVLKKQKGYKIEGLYKDQKLTQKYKDDEVIKEDTTVYVKYVPITYTVILHYNDENGNEVTEPVSVQYGYSVVYETPASYKTNWGTYNFSGWTDAHGNEFSLNNIMFEDESIETVDVYAKYEGVAYEFTINFSSNGSDLKEIPIIITKGEDTLDQYGTLHYGDKIKISAKKVNGYFINIDFASSTGIKEVDVEGETMYEVTGDVTIHYTVTEAYSLSFDSGVTVELINEDGTYTLLAQGADVVKAGDKLRITRKVSKGMRETEFSIAGTSFVDNVEETGATIVSVTGNVTVTFEQEYIEYSVIVPEGVTVTHNGTEYNAGESFTTHYGDELTITYAQWEGCSNFKLGVKNAELKEGDVYVVTAEGDIEITFSYDYAYSYLTFAECDGGVEVTAFDGSATDIVIPATYKGKKVVGIANNVFMSSSITSVKISEGVTSIGNGVFAACTSLTSVVFPSSLTSIGQGAFGKCSGLTSITLPSSLTEIGGAAFGGCIGLTSIKVEEGNAVYTSRDNSGKEVNALIDKTTGTLLQTSLNTAIPTDGSVKIIGTYAFGYFENITTIVIPSSVSIIEKYAFYGCTGLTSITLSEGVISIGNNAFFNCTSLTSITIPSGVTDIGASVFHECTGLTSVTIESRDVYLAATGTTHNVGCLLDNATEIRVPKNIVDNNVNSFLNGVNYDRYIDGDYYVFVPATEYRYLTFSYNSAAETFEVIGFDNSVTNVVVPSTYQGKKVAKIADSAFANSGVNTVIISEGITSIGDGAFGKCSNLTSITIPSTVSSIDLGAFFDCINLTTVIIESSAIYEAATGTDNNTLGGLLAYATEIRVSKSIVESYSNSYLMSEDFENELDGNYYVFNMVIDYSYLTFTYNEELGGYEVTKFDNSVTDVVIPARYQGEKVIGIASSRGLMSGIFYKASITSLVIKNGVTSIGDYAFYDCSMLTSVKIPDSVTNIGTNAFAICSKLTSIVIPNGVTTIKEWTFSGCKSLSSVVIPYGVVSIEKSAFNSCTSINSITIPSSVTSIGENAFAGLISIKSLEIPSSVINIGNLAFQSCSNLISVKIPASVINLGESIFTSCSKLTTVELCEGVSSVSAGMFKNCTSLTTIVIPSSVTSIGDEAFSGCSGLSSIIFLEGLTSIGDKAFRDCKSLTSVEIPDSLTSIEDNAFYGCSNLTSVTFKNTEGWTSYGTKVDVSDPAKNAQHLASTYTSRVWKRS